MNNQNSDPIQPPNQSAPSQNPSMNSSSSKILIVAFILIGINVIFWLMFFAKLNVHQKSENLSVSSTLHNQDSSIVSSSLASTIDIKNYIENGGEFSVEWNQGAIPVDQEDSMRLLSGVNPAYRDLLPRGFSAGTNQFVVLQVCDECEVFLFEAGTLSAPSELVGATVYHVFFPNEGMGIHYQHTLAVYLSEKNEFLQIKDAPDSRTSYRYDFDQWKVFTDEVEYEFEELTNIPETLSITDRNVFLRKVTSYYPKNTGESMAVLVERVSGNVGGVYDVNTQKVVQPEDLGAVLANHDQYGPVYFDGDRYSIQLADGSVYLYEVEPPFIVDKSPEDKVLYRSAFQVEITWEAEVATVLSEDNKFRYGGEIGTNGCGIDIVSLTDTVTDSEWFDASELIQIGRAANGDPIFELRNKATNSYYREFFEFGFSGYVYNSHLEDEGERERINNFSEEQQYQLFLNSYPMFFWQDGAGDWHLYIRNEYGTLAECGKPVIYLYPEQEITANVQVNPNGGFTITDPKYPEGRGWTVLAKPSGDLTLLSSGKPYPYLFWEGHATGFVYPEEGFVFAQSDVPKEMRQVLLSAGLNQQETEDFMEYWEPKMMKKNFVRIHLAAQAEFEQAAPLKVTPQPDTTFRLFASIEPIDEFVEVPPMQLKPFERKGFTVVEWGGVFIN